MGYQKKIPQGIMDKLEPTIEKMNSLKVGQACLISVPSAVVRKTRDYLYTYLRNCGKKGLYKISMIGQDKLLILRKEDFEIHLIGETTLNTLPAELVEVFEKKVLFLKEEELLPTLRSLRDNEEITAEQLLLLAEQWRLVYEEKEE